jgi:hypothetical protein
MNEPVTPVTTTEVANLLTQLRTLSPRQPGDLAARAAALAAKADLLTRIADQHARDWPCPHAEQARQVAHDAHVVAAHARAVAEHARTDPEDNLP